MFGVLTASMVADWFFVRKPMIDYYARMETEHKANIEELVRITKRLK